MKLGQAPLKPTIDPVKFRVAILKADLIMRGETVRGLAQSLDKKPHQIMRAIRRDTQTPLGEVLASLIQRGPLRAYLELGDWIAVPVGATPEEQKTENLRRLLRAHLESHPELSQRSIGKKIGLTSMPISQWLSGKYPGNPARINAKVTRYLQANGIQVETAVSA